MFLGVIFFQIMLSEMLPTTGYLTDMHYFTFFSTILPVLIAISHTVIFGAATKGARKAELLDLVMKLRKSPNRMRKIILVQRRVRVFLARKHLQQSRLLRTQVLPAGSEGIALDASEDRARSSLGQAMFGAQQPRSSSCKAKIRRLSARFNDAIERVCVYGVSWTNWTMALAFAVSYIVVVMVIFKGQGGDPCK